jgi:hypothetical protein
MRATFDEVDTAGWIAISAVRAMLAIDLPPPDHTLIGSHTNKALTLIGWGLFFRFGNLDRLCETLISEPPDE